MKKGVRTVLIAAGFVLIAAVLYLIYGLNSSRRSQVTCSGLKVEFADNLGFVTADDIEAYLNESYGAYIGQKIDSVDLAKVEEILDSKSAILKTEAYTTPDGSLHVKVYQRRPVVCFRKEGYGFYADERGYIFPIQGDSVPGIIAIGGNVPLSVRKGFRGEPESDREKKWLSETISFMEFLNGSKTWSGFFSRISVDSNGDLVLTPKEGKEVFIFGEPSGVKDKFSKIEDYYRAIVPARGEGTYSRINLKYNNQIVCRK